MVRTVEEMPSWTKVKAEWEGRYESRGPGGGRIWV